MTLPSVGITLSLYDGSGDPITSGAAVFTPTTQFAGTDGIEEFVAEPITVRLDSATFPVSAALLPTDLPAAPSWAWQVAFEGVTMESFTFRAPAGPVSFTGATGTPGVATWTATSAVTKLPAGTGVKLAGGSLPAGVTAGTTYYVVSPSGQTLSLSATPGGSAIAFTGTGSGTITVATYYLAGLAPLGSSLSLSEYILTPGGSPSAGQALVATGTGNAVAWASVLPGLAQASVSASGTLALNTITTVTAASALTMTLPAPVAVDLIVVERESASTANVAVTGNIRGAAGTTVTLQLGTESEVFYATGGSWWPVGGHKSLSSLDSRYAARAKTPFITVSPIGTSNGTALPNNGMDFGPDTSGTTTQGLQEAATYAVSLVSGISGTLAPPTLLLGAGPAVFEISSTINIPAPTGVSGNGIGFGIMGAGHLSTKVRFHAGAGFAFGKYGWQDVVIQDMCIESANGGTQTSLISVAGGSATFPTFRSEMMLERVWFETPVSLASLPSNGCIYMGPDPTSGDSNFGQTGGWDLYITGCVVAAGSFSITTPYDISFLNTLVNSGPNVQFSTNSPIIHINSSEITGQIVLTGTNQRLRIDKCYWNEIPATSGAVAAAATTGTTCVTVRDSTVNLLGTGPVVKQSAAVVEMHFECNSMFVAASGNYTTVGGGAQLSHTSTVRGNHPDGFLGAPAATVQAVSITTNPPVSGTAQQNLLGTPVLFAVPVTFSPTSGAAATCEVDVGTSNNPGAISTDTWPANSPAGIIQTMRFRVPAGYFWRLTTVNATIGTAAAVPEL